jgi:glycerol uptake facilitator-like aquaporin
VKDYGTYKLKPDQNNPMYFDLDATSPSVYWARLFFQEVFLSFLFGIIYFILRFEPSMRKVDRLVKGIAATFSLILCYTMSAGSGACLNTALGFAESLYMIGLENRNGSTQGDDDAKFMWVYVFGPFFGILLATLFYKLHEYIEKHEYKQN